MKTKKETVNTKWELWSYDVWGNDREGYEVNDKSCFDREYPLTLNVETFNQGTKQEFKAAYPSDRQIREAFGLKRVQLSLDGDDLTIFVNHAASGYPLGEMHCVSHESLSPIRSA